MLDSVTLQLTTVEVADVSFPSDIASLPIPTIFSFCLIPMRLPFLRTSVVVVQADEACS